MVDTGGTVPGLGSFSILLSCAVDGTGLSLASPILGLNLALMGVGLLLCVSTALDKSRRMLHFASGFWLLLYIAAVSTVSFWHVRKVIWRGDVSLPSEQEPLANKIVPSFDSRDCMSGGFRRRQRHSGNTPAEWTMTSAGWGGCQAASCAGFS